ncbi:outer membrane protein [Azomonas agilis]|uniref:Outer membrane protein n=1 Tax=Azomonas agilis TaxID=116849 RepID=A0A562IZT6_9GAMM|nr:TolC family outer membrane protein [Azomonas agilis]TWH76045.1 outer membrane protein [Azomonas agilis]
MHSLILCLIGLSISLGLTFEAKAAPVKASTYQSDLMQLYREARLEDPRVISAKAKAQAGEDREREAFGQLLPQVSATANFNRQTRDNSSSRDSYNTQRRALTLTQHLYNKPVWEKYQGAQNLAQQAEFEGEDVQAEAAVDLAKRYFAALAADDDLDLVIAERQANQKNLDRINALYARQLAMITDVLELQARVDELAANEVEARNQVRLAREALSEVIGRPVSEKLSRIKDEVALYTPDSSLDSWIEQATTSNPALKSKNSALEAADAALREGKGGHYPTLGLNLSVQRNDTGFDNTASSRSDSYVAALSIQVPIYSGGSTSARVRALHSDRLVAEQTRESVRRQVIKETTSAYLSIQSSVDKVRAYHKAVESAQKSSIAAQKGFQFGVVNAVDVLSAVQKEYEARRDLLKSHYDFITSLLALNRWAGKFSEQTMENVNVWLGNAEKQKVTKR